MMGNCEIKKITITLSLSLLVFMILMPGFIQINHVFAEEKFSIEAKINPKSLNNPDKLKVVASANGEYQQNT